MRVSHNAYAELPDVSPALHTRKEVEDYLEKLLVRLTLREISNEELLNLFRAMRYEVRSWSNNTIQGNYFGTRIDIRISHTILRKLRQERKESYAKLN